MPSRARSVISPPCAAVTYPAGPAGPPSRLCDGRPAILTALNEALTKADWEAVGNATHGLKSSLDGSGVESPRLVIREVEAYGERPPEPAHAAQQVALVRTTTEM